MRSLLSTTCAFALFTVSCPADAQHGRAKLPPHQALKSALTEARKQGNGGLNLDMWATIVDRSGVVCAVAFSGATVDAQWPGSRVISAQKANAANAFSSAVQPGGSLFGLQESNPVDTNFAYGGSDAVFGSVSDPLVNKRIGGVNVFGGGLPLYDEKGALLGGLGVSGDTSCADHNIAWRTRNTLKLDYVPAGVSPVKNDQIIYDRTEGKSAGGFGHPTCGGTEDQVAGFLPATSRSK
jgi:uncharacterized protein GlcG (DUF336 family)